MANSALKLSSQQIINPKLKKRGGRPIPPPPREKTQSGGGAIPLPPPRKGK